MRRLRDIKKSIGHTRIESKPQANKAILGHLLAEFATVRGDTSTPVKRCDWRIVAGSRGVKITAAAAVILALIVIGRPPREARRPPLESRTRSAADLLTVGCLNAVHRRGGIEAVAQQCEEAAKRMENRPQPIAIDELIGELERMQPTKGRDHEDHI